MLDFNNYTEEELNEVSKKTMNTRMQDTLSGSVDGDVHVADDMEEEYIQRYLKKYVFNIDLQTNLFAGIQFPSLPTNFQMLMSKMDFPEKAMDNINNSLFMDPADIDKTSADDIAKQLFNSKAFRDKTGLRNTLNPFAWGREFESVAYDYLSAVLEDTPDMSGLNIKTKDTKSINQRAEQASMNVVQAITTYVKRSVDVIKPLLELTGGSNAVKDAAKAIITANSTGKDSVKKWLDSVSQIKKDYTEGLKNHQLSVARNAYSSVVDSTKFIQCVAISKIPSNTTMKDYISKIARIA